MSHWVYGVDSSFDELTLAEARKLKDAGVQVYAQALWTGREQPGPRIVSLRNALNAGIPKLVGYISVSNNGRDGTWHVNQGRAGVPDDIWNALAKVPIDVELQGLTMQTHVLPALGRAAALGKPQDVYTNWNTWVSILGNPRRPNGVGLWNAFWDGAPDFDFPSLRFGGWQDDEVWGEQWSGGTYIQGQFADRNQFRSEAFGIEHAPPSTPTPTPPAPTLQALRAAQVAAGLFLEVEAKLAINIAVPTRTRDQVRWILGGTTPNTESNRQLLQVLCSYAASRALTGQPIDEDTRRRLRYAVR
jgi:hypothetical protein